MSSFDSPGLDPQRRWDGQQWLRWNGSQWEPEVVAPLAGSEPASPPPSEGEPAVGPVRPPAWRQRRWQVVAGLVVVAGVVTGVVIGTSGGGSGSSGTGGSAGTGAAGGGGSSASYPTRLDTCTVEVNIAMDVQVNQTGSVFTAIGDVTPIYQLSEGALQQFSYLQIQVGSTDAETQILPKIEQACTQAGDPILTSGQVQGLSQISTAQDSSNLSAVTLFAPSDSGS